MRKKYVTFVTMTLKNKPDNFEQLADGEKVKIADEMFKTVSRRGRLKEETIIKIAKKHNAIEVKAKIAFHDESQRGGFLGEEIILDQKLGVN